jgi:putative membrane protein
LLLAGALVAPVHWIGERLFAAHMIEHEVIMVVAAPLIVLSMPGAALIWSLPLPLRIAIGNVMRSRAFGHVWHARGGLGLARATVR